MTKVILTMTTVPNRLKTHNDESMKRLLDILLNMSYGNYELHFNIPFLHKKTGEEYIIPNWMTELTSDKFKIFRTQDYGPITKILPTIQRIDEPETILITVDDDLIYIDGLIEYHLKKRELYPNCALGFAGLTALDGTCHFCTTIKKDTRVKLLEGYKTVSYKRSFFEPDFFEFYTSSWNDDVVLSSYMGMKDIHKIVMSYDGDTDFSPRVESFPCVGHLPHERGGCFHFRNDGTPDNHEQLYKLGYLEK